MFCANWPAPESVKTIQTTRLGGVSQPPFESLNLGAHVGDNVECVKQNRALINAPGSICWLDQVHGQDMVELPTQTHLAYPPQADAVYTFAPNQVCAVMTADCLPVLLTDSQARFVAAVHCGWRGLASGILTKTLTTITSKTQSPLTQIIAWLGPAIGPLKFEVGDEVRQCFMDKELAYQNSFIQSSALKSQHKWFANIYQLAEIELNQLGVTQIYSDRECTMNQPDDYFSYRRDGQTGRQASLIWLQEN